MQRIDRRRLLKLSGAGTVAATTGGLAGILATGRAPAYAQATTLHWVKPVDFVPISDQILKGKIKEECQKALGITLNVETIEGNGVQARTTSAIQSGAGPDIIMELNNWSQLYAESTVDVSDIAEEVGNAQGQVFALVVMVVAACEVVVGLGLIVAIFRRKLPLDVDDLRSLRG